MDLIKEKWNKSEIDEFNKYLYNQRIEEKIDFTKRTVNTNMEVLAIPVPMLRKIAKQIEKGNYISFLDNNNNKYYENTMINVFLINKIEDIELKKHYFSKLEIDNWATVDAMAFKIQGKEKEYIKLSKEYLKDENPFFRRIGVRILFNYSKNEDLTEIFKIINSLYNEEEYYVNMAVAWLICEIVINNRENALKYLESHKLNTFTINKAISKCRDSFRISNEDKQMLLKYKAKSSNN